MRCPFCNSEDTKVVDSRSFMDGFSIKRRRECIKCEKDLLLMKNRRNSFIYCKKTIEEKI